MTTTPVGRRGSHRTLKEFALIGTGKILSMSALFVCGVIVARVGGTAEFGLYSTAIAAILILDAMIGSPLDYSAVRFAAVHRGEHARIDRFQAATFRLKIGLASLFFAACALAAPSIAGFVFNDEHRTMLVYLMLASTFALLLVRGTASQLQIHSRFRAYALLDASSAALRLLFLGVVVLCGARAAEPLVGVFGASAVVVFLIFLCVPQPYFLARWPERGDARSILKFITATSGVIILGTITGRADIPILNAVTSPHTAGVYAAAAQIAMIATMVAGYACVVFQPKLIPLAREGRLAPLIRLNVLAGVVLGLVALPLVIWALPTLIVAVFGESYSDSIPILRILLIGTWLDFLFMPILMTFAQQVRPLRCLFGEAAVVAAFFACVPIVSHASEGEAAITMAWIMTAVRVAKMVLYTTVTLIEMRDPTFKRVEAEGAPIQIT